jgi:hypothetical protein
MLWVAIAFGVFLILGVIAAIAALVEGVIDTVRRIYDYFYSLF